MLFSFATEQTFKLIVIPRANSIPKSTIYIDHIRTITLYRYLEAASYHRATSLIFESVILEQCHLIVRKIKSVRRFSHRGMLQILWKLKENIEKLIWNSRSYTNTLYSIYHYVRHWAAFFVQLFVFHYWQELFLC